MPRLILFLEATQRMFAWFVVFICGFCLMTTELLASRLIAPFFGLALDVWTGILAVVLLGVIAGVALGGWIADRAQSFLLLPVILGAATFSVGVLPVLLPHLFPVLGAFPWILRLGVCLVILLVPPACLLMLPQPLLARLELQQTTAAGQTVGHISAAQSAGSILGTVLSGFVFLSFAPAALVASIMVWVMAGLALLSCLYAFLLPQQNV